MTVTDAPLVTPDEIRASVTGLDDTGKFPDARLARLVTRFEELVVNYRGVSPMPRAATETVQVGNGRRLFLSRGRVTEITAIAYDTGTAPEVADIVIRNGFDLSLEAGWPCGTWATVSYVHGYTTPPAALVDGCIEFVRAEALQQAGSQPRNVTGVRDDLGWSYEATADWSKGRPTKWMVVNDALNSIPDERVPGIA